MSLTNSPSLQEYKEGIPQRPRDPADRKKVFRLVLLALLVIALGLFSSQFLQSNVAALLTSKGTLSGRVTDGHGQPLAARVFVFGVDRPVNTAADGTFTYSNAPAGARSLIVVYNGTAQEFKAQVQAGMTTDMGTLAFPDTTPVAQP